MLDNTVLKDGYYTVIINHNDLTVTYTHRLYNHMECTMQYKKTPDDMLFVSRTSLYEVPENVKDLLKSVNIPFPD